MFQSNALREALLRTGTKRNRIGIFRATGVPVWHVIRFIGLCTSYRASTRAHCTQFCGVGAM